MVWQTVQIRDEKKQCLFSMATVQPARSKGSEVDCDVAQGRGMQ